MRSVTVGGILHALADPARLAIVIQLIHEEMNCGDTVHRADLKDLPKSTASHHFRILREAGLIHSERRGLEMISRVRRVELDERFPGLLKTILLSSARQKGIATKVAKGRRRAG